MIKLYELYMIFYILHCHYRLSDDLMQEALRHILPWNILRQWTLETSQDHSEMNLKDPRSWKSIL